MTPVMKTIRWAVNQTRYRCHSVYGGCSGWWEVVKNIPLGNSRLGNPYETVIWGIMTEARL